MNAYRYLIILLFLGLYNGALAQPAGEAGEPTPEELDAAFTAEDAAREAAAFSDEIIERGTEDPLAAMTGAADLVVRGRVISQSVEYDGNDLPFTHTTIAVDEVLAGENSSGQITIVQEGGPSRTDPEMVYMVSSAQHFNTGDEEVLFLGVEPGSQGAQQQLEVRERFRIHEGKVYTQTGRGVILDSPPGKAQRRLRVSADRHPDTRFRQFNIGPHTFTQHYVDNGNEGDSTSSAVGRSAAAGAGAAAPRFTDSVDAATFTAAISE